MKRKKSIKREKYINEHNKMSKHVSRFLLYSNYYKNPPIFQRFLIKTRLSQQMRFQHTEQSKRPQSPLDQRKVPITWKNLTVLALGAAGLVGVLKYIKKEKDAGNIKSLVFN